MLPHAHFPLPISGEDKLGISIYKTGDCAKTHTKKMHNTHRIYCHLIFDFGFREFSRAIILYNVESQLKKLSKEVED